MKKFLSVMLAVLVIVPCAILFTGCGAKGTYEVESVTMAGVSITTRDAFEEKYGKKFDYENANAIEKAAAIVAANIYCTTIELKGDGTVVYGFDEPKWWPEDKKVEDKASDLTWKEEEDGSIGFYFGDVKTGDATYEDGKIKVGGVVYTKAGLF